MEEFLNIGEAAKLCGVHIDTLRRWEQKGQIKPSYTKGGHRRYAVSDLEGFMKPEKIWVSFVHRDRNRVSPFQIERLPNEGDLIWLNFSCFEVDKIVHSYIQNGGFPNCDPANPSPHNICIFIKDISLDDAIYYECSDIYKYELNEYLGDFDSTEIKIKGINYSAQVCRHLHESTDYRVQMFIEKDEAVLFPVDSKHKITLSNGETFFGKVYHIYEYKLALQIALYEVK